MGRSWVHSGSKQTTTTSNRNNIQQLTRFFTCGKSRKMEDKRSVGIQSQATLQSLAHHPLMPWVLKMFRNHLGQMMRTSAGKTWRHCCRWNSGMSHSQPARKLREIDLNNKDMCAANQSINNNGKKRERKNLGSLRCKDSRTGSWESVLSESLLIGAYVNLYSADVSHQGVSLAPTVRQTGKERIHPAHWEVPGAFVPPAAFGDLLLHLHWAAFTTKRMWYPHRRTRDTRKDHEEIMKSRSSAPKQSPLHSCSEVCRLVAGD